MYIKYSIYVQLFIRVCTGALWILCTYFKRFRLEFSTFCTTALYTVFLQVLWSDFAFMYIKPVHKSSQYIYVHKHLQRSFVRTASRGRLYNRSCTASLLQRVLYKATVTTLVVQPVCTEACTNCFVQKRLYESGSIKLLYNAFVQSFFFFC